MMKVSVYLSMAATARFLVLAVIVMFSGSVTSAPESGVTDIQEAALRYEEALSSYQVGEIKTAIIHLKNALKNDPKHLPSRILLGKAYLENRELTLAEQELLMALGLGADKDVVNIPLAEVYFSQRKFRHLVQRIRPETHGKTAAGKLALIHGEAHLELGEFDKAELMFDLAVRLGVDPGHALVGRARIALNRGEMFRAEGLIDDALAANALNADAWFYKGKFEEARGNVEAAFLAQNRAIEADEEHYPARLRRVIFYVSRRQYEEAMPDLEFLLAGTPYDPMPMYLHGIVLAKTGDMEAGLKALDKASAVLAVTPEDSLMKDPRLLLLASAAAYDMGRFEVAAPYLEKYHQMDPEHPAVLKRLAAIYLSRGKADEALEMLKPLLSPVLADAQILGLAGNAYLQKKDFKNATALFEQAAAVDPGDKQVKLDLIRGHLGSGRIDQATGMLEDLHESHQVGARSEILLAMLYMRRGETAKAVELSKDITKREPDNLLALNLLGAAQLASGDLMRARLALEKALIFDPEYLPAKLNLGLLDAREGNPDLARQRFDKILAADPEHKGALSAYSRLEEGLGRMDGAIRWLEKLRAHHPHDIRHNSKLIDLYLRAGDPGKALEIARKQNQQYPNDFSVNFALAVCELAAGRADLARVTLRNLSTQLAYDASKLYPVAELQMRAGATKAAYWSLFKAVDEEPEFLKAQVALTRVEIALGKLDDALKRSYFIQAKNPGEGIGFVLEGDVHLIRRAYPLADDAYRRALAVDSNRENLLKVYKNLNSMGKEDSALTLLKEWQEGHPNDLVVQGFLAAALSRSGRYSEAREQYEALLSIRPDDPGTLNNLAMLYQLDGDDRALTTARKAYSLASNNPYVADTLGWILVGKGQSEQGLQYLREAQSRQADLPDLHYHLAVALHNLKRDEQAERELRTFLNSDQPAEAKEKASKLMEELEKR